jgi:hypothetical protein
MLRSINLSEKLKWFSESFWFFKNHFLIIFSLGLVAALGRAIQLEAFGSISTSFHIILEIVIELARLLIFLYALGLSNIRFGWRRVVTLFRKKGSWSSNWNIAVSQLKIQWRLLVFNLTVFLALAAVINLLIDYATYQTCLYAKLQANQLISPKASEWALILFFKNISVIPFTLVFNALFLLWITNKLTGTTEYKPKFN